jgi:hypothetical protein
MLFSNILKKRKKNKKKKNEAESYTLDTHVDILCECVVLLFLSGGNSSQEGKHRAG